MQDFDRGALARLGFGPELSEALAGVDAAGQLIAGRVSADRRGAYEVLTANGELRAQLAGRLQYLASGPLDLPAVGDWVALAPRLEEGAGTIHHVLPRRGALVRKVPERPVEGQILAAHVDAVLAVASANRIFNARRIERVVALAVESGAQPIVVLSKSDLCEDLAPLYEASEAVAAGGPVVALSSLTGEGIGSLEPHLAPGRTLALIGSSGVGKSTLVNRLLGAELQAILATRDVDDKGRHATTHRQLLVLPGGAILIDTPGLREVGLWEDAGGLAGAFPDVAELADACRFPDCVHAGEPGCAVAAAIEAGDLAPERLASFRKLGREVAHVEGQRDARARHERRQRQKRFTKSIRKRPDKRRWSDREP